MEHPDPTGPVRLMTAISNIFAPLDNVLRIAVFGSLARGDSDRWSDVDMLVVTAHRAGFRATFDHLCQHKTVRYHAPFTPQVDPCGGRVLGIVFEDESVFHCLDLNFLTAAEYRSAGALDRFGALRQLYHTPDTNTKTDGDESDDLAGEIEAPLETQISTAIHFTKKNIKKILRGGDAADDLRTWSERLQAAIQDIDVEPRPGILFLARRYLAMAEAIITGQLE